ncbi:MAG: hypothetical protein JOZ29_14325 [Deltaproteobacteria bacterium]|nr:hypothetical protein [Deltaproteobacteria bacterium]MBV8453427.1 hypothetical protein [Deltaproteobacteria bacterium]
MIRPLSPIPNGRPYFEKITSLAPLIREHAGRAEREAQMPREVADALIKPEWFKSFSRAAWAAAN